MTAAVLPYGAWWSTPFSRWQGSFCELHAIRFAAQVAKGALAARNIDPAAIDFGVLGNTIPQKGSFYGAPWLFGELSAPSVAGPTISQACATGARILAVARDEVLRGDASVALAIAADRVSNGPQIYYPSAAGPGGAGAHESFVLDNFSHDPFARCAMIDTAENVAAEHGVGREEQDDVTIRRYEQYRDALRDDRAFQRRYMTLPFEVPDKAFRNIAGHLNGDEGVHDARKDAIRARRPVREGGTVTHAGQTHPADGNAGIFVAKRERAAELSADPGILVEILGIGQARVKAAHMPAAPIPAAARALDAAGVKAEDLAAVKTHNPFVVNDIVLARALGIDVMSFNDFGCSLVWGHPQGPTGLRAIIELIEALALRGGGVGLFAGCAAGDSAMAVIVRVSDA
ncbi:MAG: thiolase family protein [Pseudomonadota bacterium]